MASAGPEGLRAALEPHVARLTADESDLRAWSAAGRLLDSHRHWAHAAAAYDRAIELDPGDAALAFHRARMDYEQGALDAAILRIAGAIALAPDRGAIRWRSGLWLSEAGRMDEAEAAFERAHQLDPQDPSASIGHARLLLDFGRAREAAELLRARGLDRASPHAAQLLVRALREMGEEVPRMPGVATPHHWADPWIDELEELRTGGGEDLDAVQSLILAGRNVEAVEAAEALLAERPDDVTVQGMVAAACARARMPERALPMLRAARERRPRHYRIALNLSVNAAAAGRHEEALGAARAAVALHPDHATAQYQLGRTADRSGELEEALDAYTRARDLGLVRESLDRRIATLSSSGVPR